MNLYSCAREKDLMSAMRDGTWPNGCDTELRAHVARCADCNDLVLVNQTLQHIRVASASVAVLPPPSLLWWKAQLRRRNAALEQINQPVALIGKFALASTLAAAIALTISKSAGISEWLHWLASLSSSDAFRLDALLSGSQMMTGLAFGFLILGLGAVALIGGVAVYLFSSHE